MINQKKTPMRRCTGCLTMKNKSELIRVVKLNSGVFEIDLTGKKPGRGAYVCPQKGCIEKAAKHKGFERSFKQAVPIEVYEKLKTDIESEVGGLQEL